MNSDPVLEELISQIGDWGRYQFRQHVLHLLGGFLAGLHMLALVAIAPTPPHRCYIPELDANRTSPPTFNVSELTPYIPVTDGQWDKCMKYDLLTNATVGCGEEYVYDRSYYHESRVITWNLVCDKRWERAMIQAIYIFGVLVGAIVLGPMADKYGRKTVFCISGVLQLFMGLAAAFAMNFPLYCAILFFYGAFASAGSYIAGFCLTMELVGPSKRTICGTAFSGAFAIGVMVVAIWGYFISNITTLQIIYSLHSVSLFAHWWLIDESIRWLWGQGRTTEAIKIVKKAAKMNGKPFDSKFDGKLPTESDAGPGRSYGILDLFRTPVLRSRAINVAFCWFANSIVYYGLSLNTGNLEGNPYIVLFLIGLAEIPGYFLVIGLVDRTGRRSLCSTLMLLGGTTCIVVAFIPAGEVVTGIVMLGKLCIAGSFAIAYNYTAELFPTVIRNSAVGVGAMAARFSGMLTPLLTLLDSVGKQLPTVIFGTIAILSALCTLFLPETLNKRMPQTVEEGERFGVGDTGYRTCLNFCRGKPQIDEPNEVTERLNPDSS